VGGPCTPWVTLAEAQEVPDADKLDPDLLDEMCTVASEILYKLSGRQYAGVCTDTVLPLQRWYNIEGNQYFSPAWTNWRSWWGVHNYACGRPPERAGGCGPLSEITLGVYPLRTIVEVRIDGQVIDPTTYRIDDHRWLVRVDQTGPQSWPCCSNLAADPLTDLNTFQVIDTWGTAPPVSGVRAAKRLAIELAKGESGEPCNLPQRVLTLQMQGVNYTLLDPLTFLDEGKTGIYLVDLFLHAVNPNGLARRASVLSPDIRRPVRRASTIPGS
jgi:hypothetical protein